MDSFLVSAWHSVYGWRLLDFVLLPVIISIYSAVLLKVTSVFPNVFRVQKHSHFSMHWLFFCLCQFWKKLKPNKRFLMHIFNVSSKPWGMFFKKSSSLNCFTKYWITLKLVTFSNVSVWSQKNSSMGQHSLMHFQHFLKFGE